jgi:hypothetical protein
MGQSAEELRYEIESTRADLGETLDAIGDRLSPSRMVDRRRNRMRAGVHRFRERVMGTATDARERVTAPAHAAVDAGGEGISSAVGMVRDAPDMLRERTQGSPLAVGVVAAGLGFLAAALLPASAKEEELERELVHRAEPLKQELTEAGREAAKHLKEPAREAMEQLKSTAQEGASQVAGQAKSAASDVTQQAKS